MTISYHCVFTWEQNTSAEARGWRLVNQRNLRRHHTILNGGCTHKPKTLNRLCIQLQQTVRRQIGFITVASNWHYHTGHNKSREWGNIQTKLQKTLPAEPNFLTSLLETGIIRLDMVKLKNAWITNNTQRARLAQGPTGHRRNWLDSVGLTAVKFRSNCSHSPACPCGSSIGQTWCGCVDISLCNNNHIVFILHQCHK